MDNHDGLEIQQGEAFGLRPEDYADITPSDGTVTCLHAWTHLAKNSPWLKAFAASAALELSNSEDVLTGASMSRRIGEKMAADLGIPLKEQPSNSEHMVADIEHGRILMIVARNHARTPEAQEHLLAGLRDSWAIDRVWKGQLADLLEALPDED